MMTMNKDPLVAREYFELAHASQIDSQQRIGTWEQVLLVEESARTIDQTMMPPCPEQESAPLRMQYQVSDS